MRSQPPDVPLAAAVDPGEDGPEGAGEEMHAAPETAPGRLLLNVRQEVTWAQFMEIARVLRGEPAASGDPDDDAPGA